MEYFTRKVSEWNTLQAKISQTSNSKQLTQLNRIKTLRVTRLNGILYKNRGEGGTPSHTRQLPRPTATMHTTTATMESRQRMLTRSRVARLSHISAPIPSLIALEVVELLRATSRKRSAVAIARIIPVIYVPIETMRSMEPRPCSDKHASVKPIRPIVPIRSAVIRLIVEVPVRAIRRNADPDNNL
jgi:hypothetical protein